MGYLWCFCRLYLPTPSGRQRYNVLGAIDAITHELITECNDKYINAESVCVLLSKFAKQNTAAIPTTVILDNARYQQCEYVKKHAQQLNIELLYLLSYSSN